MALYAGDLRLDFFRVDDPQYVVNNPWIRSFSLENLRHILGAPYFANYSPIHLLSYAVDFAFAGPSAFVFHLSSNVWAGVVAGFVFLVALALTGRRVIALIAAALFVVHPAHVEAIAWISSRKDLVSAAFALPSLLAYLRYCRGGTAKWWWYVASLLLFLLAVAGKLSVATFPAVFLALDYFVAKRPLLRSLPDKVPFLAAAGVIAIVAASAQPPTGNRPDPLVFATALLQNLWLIGGFGRYVIYRVPPGASASPVSALLAVILLIGVFAAPLLLRRRSPLVMVLIYWMLFAFIPSQALSFTHPVSDRYLFFPSVSVAILIAWGASAATERWRRRGFAVAVAVALLAVAFVWGRATLNYLAEWRDPRSVWYAATQKSSDPDVFYNFGWHCLDIAARLGATPRKPALPKDQERQFASLVWGHDTRLSALLLEWSQSRRGGPVEKAFQQHLWAVAWDAFKQTLEKKGKRVMPDLYFHRGLLLLDRGDLPAARNEFLAALDEASRSNFAEGREQVLVNSHNNLGILAWTAGDYREALRWLRMAEEEQSRFGGNWVPDLPANRQRLEAIIASLPGK